MTNAEARLSTLDVLSSARRVANYARRVGLDNISQTYRTSLDHLGAVLADSILQAGLNYRTVVKTRVDRILVLFPEAATLDGTIAIVRNGSVHEFLMWNHTEKVDRFVGLVSVLQCHGIENTEHLRENLRRHEIQTALLRVNGIGRKTVDYMSCLIGLDCVAVDRHLRVFVRDAGVPAHSYDEVKIVISYAADLLGLPRRDFDSWVWRLQSSRRDHKQN